MGPVRPNVVKAMDSTSHACWMPDMAITQGHEAGRDGSHQWTEVGQHAHLDLVCLHGLSNCAWWGLQLGCSTSPGSSRGPHTSKCAPREPRDSWPVLATHGPMKATIAYLQPYCVTCCWCMGCQCDVACTAQVFRLSPCHRASIRIQEQRLLTCAPFLTGCSTLNSQDMAEAAKEVCPGLTRQPSHCATCGA